jgi:chromosomal replication initiation ATPase DnaA
VPERPDSLAQQLVLDLGLRAALGRDDFLVTPANEMAVALVDSWPQWPSYGAVLAGPHGAGKTHLAEVWRQLSGAKMSAAADVTTRAVPEIASSGTVLVEDIDAPVLEENALFHLLNHVRQNGGHVLLTSSNWPLAGVKLADLDSRLRSLPAARILPPDDALLRGVLIKLFADRQIAVDEALISYLVTRMPRSLDMARMLVSRIDVAALEQGVEVTRAFAGKILATLESPDLL